MQPSGWPALVLFDLFLIRDAQLIGDIFPLASAIKLGLITPLALVMFASKAIGIENRLMTNVLALR